MNTIEELKRIGFVITLDNNNVLHAIKDCYTLMSRRAGTKLFRYGVDVISLDGIGLPDLTNFHFEVIEFRTRYSELVSLGHENLLP